MGNWKEDLSWSARAFSDLVWPPLSKILPGDIIHVEAITKSDFARDLDQTSGIDAWHIVNGRGIRGIASRVQVCPYPFDRYDTFTIRRSRDSGARTEYAKRKEAIQSSQGWLYPHLTIQSYISARSNGSLRSFAVAQTANIIAAIDHWIELEQPEDSNVYIRRTGNASFYVVEWDSVAEFIYIAETEQQEILAPASIMNTAL